MSITDNLSSIRSGLPGHVILVAVSKTHPVERIMEAYNAGQRIFGENRVQELLAKQPLLPADIEWHLIGHLQTNKVKYIIPVASLIHSVDSTRLITAINSEAHKAGKKINILLQIRIASEETKFGMLPEEAVNIANLYKNGSYGNVVIQGLMGMATLTGDEGEIRSEFTFLADLFRHLKNTAFAGDPGFNILSMGMSDDYNIAVHAGSTMVRIGSSIFGHR